MPDGQVLEFTNVTKHFNEVTAVSDFSARVEPGAVTAFLGPNGAGKTTTLRILLGQVRATSGTATIGGAAFSELRQPLRTIGSVLEETAYRPRRTASRQLTIAAKANGIPLARVDEVLGMVGLDEEGDSRIGGFSLGMRQRLSVAHALLGDPGALVFDEPANGLDPEGIRWMRLLMRRLADEGRTVLVSSHLLSEIEQVADNVLVLSKGHLVLASGIETLADPNGGSVVVDAADRAALTAALSAAGFDVEVLRSGLTVRGGDAGTVGAVAAEAGIALSTLVQRGPTLEDVFIELVRGGKLGPRAGAPAPQPVAPVDAGAIGDADIAGAGSAGAGIAGAGVVGAESADDLTADAAEPSRAAEESDAVEESSIEGASGTDVVVPEDGDEDTVGEQDSADEESVDAESVDEESTGDDTTAGVSDEENSEAAASDAIVEAPHGGNAETAAPTRSFDEILFGAAATVSPEESDQEESDQEESDQEESGHDAAEAFADSENAADDELSTSDEAPSPEGEAEADADADAEGTEGEGDHAGVEFFSEFGETADADADADSPDAEPQGDPSEVEGDDDPRSIAVSSMLAAAARAYYEDEPKDYPQGESSTEDGAQWSVASTGVIDTVPLAETTEDPSDEAEVADRDENHDGESHDDDHHGENHTGENHDGDHHDGDHHDDRHDGEHHGDQHHG